MHKQIIFRDRQELQSSDLDNIQSHTSDTLKALTSDAIADDILYAGLAVAKISATEVTVESGRLYNNGQMYISEQQLTLNLSTLLPLTAKKLVAITCWGSEIETNVEPRDFLIDLAAGTTEPQSVAMERLRQANIDKAAGTESTDPHAPVLSAGVIAIAHVILTPAGIESVTMQTAVEMPKLEATNQRVSTLETWKNRAQPRIDSIATDLSALAEKTKDLATLDVLIDVSIGLASLREKLNFPDAYSSFAADNFLDNTESDINVAGYDADIDQGLIFPTEVAANINLALANPVDPALYIGVNNDILPKFSDVLKINTGNQLSSTISISQYQTQTLTKKKLTKTTYSWRVGWRWAKKIKKVVHSSNSHVGTGVVEIIHKRVKQSFRYRVSHPSTSYIQEPTATSVTGALVAQTFLVSNAMWLTKAGVFLTQVGATGDLTVQITETVNGKPDLLNVLTETTVSQADLQTYPNRTNVIFPPVLLEAGKRYAINYISQGDHYLAVVDGNNYTQGTLFSGVDGDFLTGDATKDLMFELYAAQFTSPRTEVDMGALSLAGGMTDMSIDATHLVPEGTELHYEVRVGGVWHRLDDGIDHLEGAPDLIQLRAVFLGTHDLQPLLTVTNDAVAVSRAAETMTHWSTLRTLPNLSDNIIVDLVVADYDSVNHSITITLDDAGTAYAATAVTESIEGPQLTRIRSTFAPVPGTGIGSYKIKTVATRATGSEPFSISERIDVAV